MGGNSHLRSTRWDGEDKSMFIHIKDFKKGIGRLPYQYS